MITIASFFCISLMALVHIFVGRCSFIKSHDSPWHSFAGGAAVSYVFIYVLPKLASAQQILLQSEETGLVGFLEYHAYLIALTGFVAHYAVDRAALLPSERLEKHPWRLKLLEALHIAMYGAYVLVVGYMFAEIEHPVILLMSTVVMALHFLSTSELVRQRYIMIYDRYIRWTAVSFLLVGWLVGARITFPENKEALWFAFLAGGILIHAIEGELPLREHHRLGSFLLGVVLFTTLILAIRHLSNLN